MGKGDLLSASVINTACGVLCIALLGAILYSEEGADVAQITDVQLTQLDSVQGTVATLQREADVSRAAVDREKSLLMAARQASAGVSSNLSATILVLQETKLLATETNQELVSAKLAVDQLHAELQRCVGANERRLKEATDKLAELQTKHKMLAAELAGVRNSTSSSRPHG